MTIRVYSFSYKRGLPPDPAGNGVVHETSSDIVERTQIVGNANDGFVGRGDLTDCNVERNGGFGIRSVAGDIARCSVVGNGGVGVDSATSLLDSCVSSNLQSGVTGVPTVTHCEVNENGADGVADSQNVQRSTVRANKGIGLKQATKVDASEVIDNGREGVTGVKTLTNTRISGNRGDGVVGISAVVTNCVIAGNQGNGITGGQSIMGTDVISNGKAGVVGGDLVSGGNVSSNGADGVSGVARVNRTTIDANRGVGLVGGSAMFCSFKNNQDGGAEDAELINCVVTGNKSIFGGGVRGGTLYNCTVVSNRSTRTYLPAGIDWDAVAYNSIVWDNFGPHGEIANYYYVPEWPDENTRLYNCCTLPATPYEAQNIAADPMFVEGGLQLLDASPCRDVASSEYVRTVNDILDKKRIQGVAPDMGAYELGGADAFGTEKTPSSEFYDWMNGYPSLLALYGGDAGVAANHLTGKTAVDGRQMTAWDDYVCGTDPTNTNKVFVATIDVEGGVPNVSWDPDLGAARLYKVFGAEDLQESWNLIPQEDIPGSPYHFFKVSVELP